MEYIQSELFLGLLYSVVFGILAGLFQTVLSFFVLVFNHEGRKGFYKKPQLPKKVFTRKNIEKNQNRDKTKNGVIYTILTFLTDVLFFIVVGIALSIFYYYISDGEFRVYILIGVVFGFFLYRLILKTPVLAVLVVLADVINFVFDLFIYIICTPFVLLYILIKRTFKKISGFISNRISISFHKMSIKELELLSKSGFLIKIKRKGTVKWEQL